MAGRKLHVVRHVEWDEGHPTFKGVEQGQRLREQFAPILGGGAVILASPEPRTIYTADALAQGSEAPIHRSVHIREGGLFPGGIENLDTFIDLALQEVGVASLPDEAALVVVTHAPMVDRVKGDWAEYGESVMHTPGPEADLMWAEQSRHLDQIALDRSIERALRPQT